MESNALCVIHSMNNTNKVSKVCLWNSMLHSPVSAADVMIVVHWCTNIMRSRIKIKQFRKLS